MTRPSPYSASTRTSSLASWQTSTRSTAESRPEIIYTRTTLHPKPEPEACNLRTLGELACLLKCRLVTIAPGIFVSLSLKP